MLDVNTGKLLDWERQMTDPTSRQRGRPTETIQQLSENNLRTESNISSQVPEWARYLDILTVSCKVTSTGKFRQSISGRKSQGGLDAKTYWLTDWPTDRQSVVKWPETSIRSIQYWESVVSRSDGLPKNELLSDCQEEFVNKCTSQANCEFVEVNKYIVN
jgi:hypothetical protein